MTCYQKYVIERCGCGDPEFPMNGAAFDYKEVKACDSSDSKQGRKGVALIYTKLL